MNRFYVITNQVKDKSLETTYRIKNYIESKGKECILAVEGQEVPETIDCVLVLGGDGTIIRAARELRSQDIPLLGINMGTLGYLAEVEVSSIEESIDRLIAGEIQVEERMMLRGTVNGKLEDIALNDIVLSRTGALRIIQFNIYVNGELLNTYRADGIIISTPTGSTAYNLSAGGPIVEPTAAMIVITPICSHALNTSSIVLSAEDEIVLEIGEGRDGRIEEAGISFDGERNIEVHTGDKVVIQKAEHTTKLLKLSKVSFLEILRKKMEGN
ncbi:MAG: NAD(+)/NADH kinase [Tyzzerella sp.]|nr:NAD(+)/NADH kinase [Tyzzerella sp.]